MRTIHQKYAIKSFRAGIFPRTVNSADKRDNYYLPRRLLASSFQVLPDLRQQHDTNKEGGDILGEEEGLPRRLSTTGGV